MKLFRPTSIAGDLAAMAWIDMRIAVNAFGRIHREPLRLAGWFFAAAFFFWKFFLQPRGIGQTAVQDVLVPIDIAASMLAFVAAIALVRGEQPAIAFFATPMEARVIAGSHLRPWITITYLQLRNVFNRLPSFAFFLVFILSYCLLPTQSFPAVCIGIANVAILTLCSRLFSLPRELAPEYLRIPLIACGICLGAYALLAAIESTATLLQLSDHLPKAIPILHPGLAFVYGAHGDLRVTALAVGMLSACIGSLVLLSRDSYPELFEISRAGWEVRSRFREGRMRHHGDESVRELTDREIARIPSGAGVLLWTSWQIYRRQNLHWWPMGRPLIAVALGLFLGLLHVTPKVLGQSLGLVFALTTTFSSLIDAMRTGVTMRHPIFWLTKVSLTARLTMIVFGWYWRSALDLALFGLGAIAGGAGMNTCISAVSMTIIGVWLQRCIGLAAFALLPSKMDLGGPTAFARFALAIVLAVPPFVLGILTSTLSHSEVLGYVFGSALAIAESQCLIYAAARLLDGRFDKILGG